MPPRNLNVIIIVGCISVFCYVTHRRTRTAMVVGDALELIDAYYVDPVDENQLLTSAMDGMIGMLDQHSEYIPREDYESFQDSINQEFAGIGIFVEQPVVGEPVRVVTPLVGSPALQAGMLPGDQIIRVDGEDVSKIPLQDVSAKLKGEIGTNVNLIIKRDDKELPMTVRRNTIKLDSVIGDYRDEKNRWVFRLRDDPNIAYFRLTSFGEKTVTELTQAIAGLNRDFSGLVLDLRGNGGGLLNAAVGVSDMFLDSGRIVSTRTRGGKSEDEFDAQPGTLIANGKPMAILMDGNSASASEIVAACLQDHQRAVVVGTRSYGKGTVQNILPLQFGRSALRLTVARYYRPNGENIHRDKDATEEDQWGVTPGDGLIVELDEASLLKVAKRWRESSYPSLALTANETGKTTPQPGTGNASPSQDENPRDEIDPASDPTSESSLMIDPQLRRAVEHIREIMETQTPQTTAA